MTSPVSAIEADYAVDNAEAISAALSDKQAVEVKASPSDVFQVLAEFYRNGQFDFGHAPEMSRRLAALVDVPAVEPGACACCGKPFGDEGPYCLCVYTHRDWKKNTMERPHRVTNYGRPTSPPLSREGEDSAEVLKALKEAVEFANKANNYIAGQDLPASAGWLAVIAKADAALAATRSGSATTHSGGDHG